MKIDVEMKNMTGIEQNHVVKLGSHTSSLTSHQKFDHECFLWRVSASLEPQTKTKPFMSPFDGKNYVQRMTIYNCE